MARPSKPGAFYFSLDVDFFSERKIKILRSRFGPDGPMFYLYTLCEVYRDKGYYLTVDKNFEDVTAVDLGVSQSKIGLMMNFMLNQSLLFDSKLFNTDKVLTSHGIQIRYQEMVKGRAVKNPVTVNARFWLLSEEETKGYIRVRPQENYSENNVDYSGKNAGNSRNNAVKESKGKEKKKRSFGGDDELARAREASPVENSMLVENSGLDGYFGMTEELKRQIYDATSELIWPCFGRQPTEHDAKKLFEHARRSVRQADGTWIAELDSNKMSVLKYAFETAAKNGVFRWDYIEGILTKAAMRGHLTRDACETYDAQRQLGRDMDKKG